MAAALIRPGAAHEVDATGVATLIAFVDPQSELGAAVLERTTSDITTVDGAETTGWRAALGEPAVLSEKVVDHWVREEFQCDRGPATIHVSIQPMLQYVREQILTDGYVSLPHLARVAGLSQSRFMHAFTDSVGVPIRPYVLWLRIQVAAGELLFGATATEAAHRAGFTDSAHLARTFRRMLGTTPSEVTLRGPKLENIATGSDYVSGQHPA